jgi:hypothetical protein
VVVAENGTDLFDIAIDPSQFSNDSAPFLGIIVIDQIVPAGTFTNDDGTTRETGPQWQLGVRPVHYALDGETGAYPTWFTPSTKTNSKMAAIITAMSKLPTVFPKTMKVGRGQLIGVVCHWVRRDMQFGRNLSRNVLIPIKEATEDEIEDAHQSIQNLGIAPAPTSESYTDEEKATLLQFLSGKTTEEAMVAAAKARGLAQKIRADILSGDAITALMGSGDIEMAVDGTITETAADAGTSNAA